ncbi:MerR family DNA-binding transcriptional regulator [Streptosporangium sp. NPDC000396]|uniref:MerR family DNA-binding transcriptional regulator n=1 Tax=Streptosporangium sp. NPDC000396 TaxID=3366185 RepID=UPI00368A438F
MMSIGEFAELTGLSLKALRLYDEQGLLKPTSVDPWSRHRRYSASQFEPAIRLKTLRAAGVPLADAPRLLGEVSEAAGALAEHRARVLAERERQDAALDALDRLLSGEGRHDWQVEERRAARQHWAGVVLPVPHDGDSAEDIDGANERADEGFGALWQALAATGNAPTGPFWSAFRAASDSDTEIELLCCWPVAHPLPAGWSMPGWTVETGTVEDSPELVVRWRFDDPVTVVDGVTHPAVLALLTTAEERGVGVDLSRLRQIGLMEQGEVVGMEVAITVNRGPE